MIHSEAPAWSMAYLKRMLRLLGADFKARDLAGWTGEQINWVGDWAWYQLNHEGNSFSIPARFQTSPEIVKKMFAAKAKGRKKK